MAEVNLQAPEQVGSVPLLCRLGIHKWKGCRCVNCSADRNKEHDWQGCKCRGCSASREEGHDADVKNSCCRFCGQFMLDRYPSLFAAHFSVLLDNIGGGIVALAARRYPQIPLKPRTYPSLKRWNRHLPEPSKVARSLSGVQGIQEALGRARVSQESIDAVMGQIYTMAGLYLATIADRCLSNAANRAVPVADKEIVKLDATLMTHKVIDACFAHPVAGKDGWCAAVAADIADVLRAAGGIDL